MSNNITNRLNKKLSAMDNSENININAQPNEIKKSKKTKKKKEKTVVSNTSSAQLEEHNDEYSELQTTLKAERSGRRKIVLTRIISVVLAILCVYLVFLVYGVFNTRYVYDEHGQIKPQVMTVEKIEAIEEFNKISVQYIQARNLYEQILVLDYRIAAGTEDPVAIAPLYDEVLNDVEALIIELKAISPDAKYTQVHSMLLQWVQTDVAVYCQRVPQAIAQNNSQYASQAVEYKTLMYNDFYLITENLIKIGGTVDGVDLNDIQKWSPEQYIRNHIG